MSEIFIFCLFAVVYKFSVNFRFIYIYLFLYVYFGIYCLFTNLFLKKLLTFLCKRKKLSQFLFTHQIGNKVFIYKKMLFSNLKDAIKYFNILLIN